MNRPLVPLIRTGLWSSLLIGHISAPNCSCKTWNLAFRGGSFGRLWHDIPPLPSWNRCPGTWRSCSGQGQLLGHMAICCTASDLHHDPASHSWRGHRLDRGSCTLVDLWSGHPLQSCVGPKRNRCRRRLWGTFVLIGKGVWTIQESLTFPQAWLSLTEQFGALLS